MWWPLQNFLLKLVVVIIDSTYCMPSPDYLILSTHYGYVVAAIITIVLHIRNLCSERLNNLCKGIWLKTYSARYWTQASWIYSLCSYGNILLFLNMNSMTLIESFNLSSLVFKKTTWALEPQTSYSTLSFVHCGVGLLILIVSFLICEMRILIYHPGLFQEG